MNVSAPKLHSSHTLFVALALCGMGVMGCRFGQEGPAENPDGTSASISENDLLLDGAKEIHPVVAQRRGIRTATAQSVWAQQALRALKGISSIVVTPDSTCARTSSDQIKCWGWNFNGVLGSDPASVVTSSTPLPVTSITGPLKSFAGGDRHVCAVTQAGGLFCFGANYFGQLGKGDTTSSFVATAPVGLSSGVLRVTAGFNKTCAIVEKNRLKCWGIGLQSSPSDVVGATSGVLQVALGQNHQCLLNERYGVECWGTNSSGQLGLDASSTGVSSPVAVSGLSSGVIQVANGANHSCALMHTGQVKCWGNNSYGQLGDGTLEQRNTPVDVVNWSGVAIALSLGNNHSCALMSTGDMQCWGRNEYGQLGDGTLNDRAFPSAVMRLQTKNVAIVAGSKHTCAMNSDETVQCWGAESLGSLGSAASSGNVTVPVNVPDF